MTEQEIDYAIHAIATHYGKKAQSMQACEECAELIQAVSKAVRSPSLEHVKNLAEEIADVQVMCSQLMWLYGISLVEVGDIIERKLKRQLERIKAESKCEYVV